ncbi:MAG TPA: methyltransferase [Pyrinomonadaceae bacterium]|nr:methyltransferase [Pyrinomonadaceae bacterium]
MNNTSAQKALELGPTEQMLQMMSGLWVSRGIWVAAKLGISDHLADGPKTADELAKLTDTHSDSLYRILRMLAMVGIYKEDGERKFSLTPLSETLLSDAVGTLRGAAIAEMGEVHYAAWGNIMHSVRTGEIAFDNHFGMDIWQYFQKDPEKAENFNRYMAASSELLNQAISTQYDFSSYKKLIDVGGGIGGMISAILDKNPGLNGAIYDAPSVVEQAKGFLASRGLSDRCETIAGDFFQSVPAGGDIYSMRWILHDWEDSKSITILENIKNVLPASGKLVLAEAVVPEVGEPHFSKFFDLIMLTMTGGRERTEKEWGTLLKRAGYRIERIIPTESFLSIIEAAVI